MIDAVVGRVVGFLPWGEEGVPEYFEAEPQPAGASNWVPRPDWVDTMTWGDIGLRVLPDGVIQLSAPTDTGVRLIRLGDQRSWLDVATPAAVLDAVLSDDGSAVLLERIAGRMHVVRRVDPDGSTSWTRVYTLVGDNWRELWDSRLLADATGRVLLANRSALLRVDDGSNRCLYRWQSARAVVYPDGRIGYSRPFARSWGYDYVTVDLDTGVETVVAVGPEFDSQFLLARLIGADGKGRVYGQALRRMSPIGELQWLPRMGGVVISADGQVLVQTFLDKERRTTRIGDLTFNLMDHSYGRLIDRDADDGYVIRERVTPVMPDKVSVFNSAGRLVRSGPSPADVALTSFVLQEPTQSSVTKDGEVLVVVKAPAGVYIVGVSPGTTDT